ncbi:uncharacterized protein B0T23DRAFT_314063 [Neurospora hispaniola]|uniref:Uncharacterized protein n=1 Tax=Neurospora hispaniola TaxID=588809 RepID=A0AAJ0IB61_9PEZI|nr:hypothetical protein B0T23DRAFT_314063 [Neurospora hispaniola]
MTLYFNTMRGVANSGTIENDDWLDFFDFELYSQETDPAVNMASGTTTTTNSPVMLVDNPTPATDSAIGNTAYYYEPAPAFSLTPGNATAPGPAPVSGAPIVQPGARTCRQNLKFHMSRETERLMAQRLRNGQYTCSGKYCGPVAAPNTSCAACRQRLRAHRLRKKLALVGNGAPPTGGGAASSAGGMSCDGAADWRIKGK